jgi:pyruvate/2-oxoglutarate dehydrogenase complex dihydrolipoamide acyltransferase (E2) component
VHHLGSLVVPPGAVAILAIRMVTAEPAASLSLSGIHRVLDRAPAAHLLGEVVSLLEHPAWIEELARGDTA